MSGKTVLKSLAITFVAGLCVAADKVDFTGHWQLDAPNSKSVSEKTLSVDIVQSGSQVKFTRVFQNQDGKEATGKFTCTVGGTDCEFVDNGHKAKVSVWFNGPELVVLKTDGDKHDSTVEWHLQLSDGGKTLKVNREIMEPGDQTEKLVFTRTESVASR
jgi:hypothetical protein